MYSTQSNPGTGYTGNYGNSYGNYQPGSSPPKKADKKCSNTFKTMGFYHKPTGYFFFNKDLIGLNAAILKKKGIVPTKIVGVSSDVWNSKIFQERLRKLEEK